MANLTLELNINSASNLANVNLITKMNVYAAVTINGDDTRKKQKVKTAVDHSGGSNPTWNHALKFAVNERLAHDGRLTLAVRLICRRVLGDKRIGEVNVPLVELLNSITPSIIGDGNVQGMKFVTYIVRSPSGKRRGSLTFSYRFKPDLPVIVNRNSFPPVNSRSTVYPPPSKSVSLPSQIEHPLSAPPVSAMKYPQLSLPPYQKTSGHQRHSVAAGSSNDPLPVSYGAALTSPPYFSSKPSYKTGYAYHHAPLPPPQLQPTNAYFPPPSPAKGIGIGLGLELGAGLLGGLMMGDLVSDVANCFDL